MQQGWLSIASFFLATYGTMALALVLVVAAGILHIKVRSRASLAFLVGMVIYYATSMIPTLLQWFAFGGAVSLGSDKIRLLVAVIAFTMQAFGLLFYAISIPKRTQKN